MRASSPVAMPLMASGILNFFLMRSTVFQSSADWIDAVLHPPASGGDEALGDVALAPAVVRGVDREGERRIAVLDRALDMVVHPVGVAAHVKLIEAQRIGRDPGELFEPRIADRAQHMSDAELPGGAHDRRRARRMEAFERADRREDQRQPHLAAELHGRGIDVADVAQDARAERERLQRHAVAPQRGLGLRSADDVVPVVLVEVLPRLGDDLMQVEKIAHLGRRVVDGRGVEFLVLRHGGRLAREEGRGEAGMMLIPPRGRQPAGELLALVKPQGRLP